MAQETPVQTHPPPSTPSSSLTEIEQKAIEAANLTISRFKPIPIPNSPPKPDDDPHSQPDSTFHFTGNIILTRSVSKDSLNGNKFPHNDGKERITQLIFLYLVSPNTPACVRFALSDCFFLLLMIYLANPHHLAKILCMPTGKKQTAKDPYLTPEAHKIWKELINPTTLETICKKILKKKVFLLAAHSAFTLEVDENDKRVISLVFFEEFNSEETNRFLFSTSSKKNPIMDTLYTALSLKKEEEKAVYWKEVTPKNPPSRIIRLIFSQEAFNTLLLKWRCLLNDPSPEKDMIPLRIEQEEINKIMTLQTREIAQEIELYSALLSLHRLYNLHPPLNFDPKKKYTFGATSLCFPTEKELCAHTLLKSLLILSLRGRIQAPQEWMDFIYFGWIDWVILSLSFPERRRLLVNWGNKALQPWTTYTSAKKICRAYQLFGFPKINSLKGEYALSIEPHERHTSDHSLKTRHHFKMILVFSGTSLMKKMKEKDSCEENLLPEASGHTNAIEMKKDSSEERGASSQQGSKTNPLAGEVSRFGRRLSEAFHQESVNARKTKSSHPTHARATWHWRTLCCEKKEENLPPKAPQITPTEDPLINEYLCVEMSLGHFIRLIRNLKEKPQTPPPCSTQRVTPYSPYPYGFFRGKDKTVSTIPQPVRVADLTLT